MNETLIKELASKIVSEQLSSMGYVYLIMLLITIVGSFFGSYLLAYAKKKAEIKVVTTHFETLLQQLEENTKTTEAIKVAVNYDDWRKREWKSLRQKKLEELLQNVYQADDWQKLNRDASLFGSSIDPGPSPLSSVRFLSALYFPELKSEIEAFVTENIKLSECISINKDLFRQIPSNLLVNEFNLKWKPIYEKQIEMIKKLETESASLISEFYI